MSYTREYHETINGYLTKEIKLYAHRNSKGEHLMDNDGILLYEIHIDGKRHIIRHPVIKNNQEFSERKEVDIDYSVPVDVNIHVDTDPFDISVFQCNTDVGRLTGAIVSTEAAQSSSIDQNAKKVGTTIIEGFFKTIHYEISQQIVELSQKIDAHLMHLHGLAKSCSAKQKQMEIDYNRISARYLKIFEDLNNELFNRIYELDKPAFLFKKENEKNAIRALISDSVSTAALFGPEEGKLLSRISVSVLKERALNSINQANHFLLKQRILESTIKQCMLNENTSSKMYYLVCFLEFQNENRLVGKNIYQTDFLPKVDLNEISEGIQNQNWTALTEEKKDSIKRYFNTEISNAYSVNNQHNDRVKEMIVNLFNINSINCI